MAAAASLDPPSTNATTPLPTPSSVITNHPISFPINPPNPPPPSPTELGTFLHAVEDEMLCLTTLQEKVPYFNAPIYLQNKTPIGKVDEILGPINQVYFSIKMGQGIVASSFKNGEKVYIAPDKILPLERFLPKPKPPRTP